MADKGKVLIIFLDGATDHPHPALGDRTPLQVADVPFLSSVASYGELGCTPSRDYTHHYLFQFLTGKAYDIPRGVIEAYGLEMDLDTKRIAYRMTPAKIKEGRVQWHYEISCSDEMALQKAVLRSRDKIKEMEPQILFYNGGKAVLTVKGREVMDLPKPPKPADVMPTDLGDFRPFAESVAELTGGITLLPWGGGTGKEAERLRADVTSLPPMTMISKSPSALGVAAFLNMPRQRVPGFKLGIKIAKDLLKKGNVFLHLEETDDISHKRAPRMKVELLESIDKELVRYAKQFSDARIVLLVDHGASSLTGNHIRMPVPYAIADQVLPLRAERRFQEGERATRELDGLLQHIFSF